MSPHISGTERATRTEANSSPAGTNFGYTLGGLVGNYNTLSYTIQRIDFANDTATGVAKGPLSEASGRLSATGNLNQGYWSGGWSPGAASFVRRIDFSNDTATGTTKGSLSISKYYTMSASASSNAFSRNS